MALALVLRGARERVEHDHDDGANRRAGPRTSLGIADAIAGHEIEHPMAIVILGGLVTSTLVNLFIIPASVPALRGEWQNAQAPPFWRPHKVA